jgi:hypothetical protein
MKLKQIIIALVLTSFFVSSTVSAVGALPVCPHFKNLRTLNAKLCDGWIEEKNGVVILHVSGTHYEMGYQHGVLLKNQVQQNIRGLLASSEISNEELLDIWNEMQPYIPIEYLDEIQGLADGADISMDDIAAAYMVIVWGDRGCFGISAWGPATKNGLLYHTRSFDLPMTINDPITGVYAHENSILVVRNPDEGYASLCPSVAGSMHGGGGINDQGIALGQQVCWSKDQTYHGIPAQIRTQMVLDHASSLDEAVEILTSEKTLGWNFVLSDGKIPMGVAVEMSANHSFVGTYSDPVESLYPFWGIEYVVRRTNLFIEPTLASTQRDRYNPGGLLGFLRLLFTPYFFFAVWRSYKALSQDLEHSWGTMDLNSTIALLRRAYQGNTDALLKIIATLSKGTSFNRAWNQWVACPQTGDMVVCFATRKKIAYENPLHFFNLYDLLNSNEKG